VLKKTVTWTDLLGDKHTDDLYFHLKQDELVEMELGHRGETFSSYLQTMVKSDDKAAILTAVKSIIAAAYGRRSEDGRTFDKDEVWTKEFMKSQAYTSLFMELVTSETAATEFVLGIFPAEMLQDPEMKKAIEQAMGGGSVKGVPVDVKLPEMPFTVTHDQEIRPMTDEELGKKMQLPAGLRRPPAERVQPGTIVLPADLQNITRDELLAAYDYQMGKRRDDPENPSPPAA
jgi:hypothetical protein